jgi:hypothetical protein
MLPRVPITPQFVPPLALDGRPSSAGAGHPPGGAAAGGTPGGGAGQVLVPSYTGAIAAQAPPAMQTITTADAMASEGRIIEDAAMHEQYVRVITPEAAPTEETEEVCWAALRCAVPCCACVALRSAGSRQERRKDVWGVGKPLLVLKQGYVLGY